MTGGADLTGSFFSKELHACGTDVVVADKFLKRHGGLDHLIGNVKLRLSISRLTKAVSRAWTILYI